MSTPVAYDTYTGKLTTSSGYSQTSVTVADHPNRVLVCFGLWRGGASANGLLINGENTGLLPIVDIRNSGTTPNSYGAVYVYPNPPVGMVTVRINNSASPDPYTVAVAAYNVNLSQPVYDYQSATNFASTISPTYNTIKGGLIIAGLVRNSTDSMSSLSNGTQLWGTANTVVGSEYRAVGAYHACNATSQETLSFNFATNRYNAIVGVCLMPIISGRQFQVIIHD